ncbi:hypothetical protein ES703_46597 [subsurface metagenome]
MESIQKFQDLLKRLFQFEASDLDFGIYRILNYRFLTISIISSPVFMKKVILSHNIATP